MKAGSRVTYLARKDWGIGLIDWVGPAGYLTVSFEIPGQGPYTGEFSPHELEDAVITQPLLPVPGRAA